MFARSYIELREAERRRATSVRYCGVYSLSVSLQICRACLLACLLFVAAAVVGSLVWSALSLWRRRACCTYSHSCVEKREGRRGRRRAPGALVVAHAHSGRVVASRTGRVIAAMAAATRQLGLQRSGVARDRRLPRWIFGTAAVAAPPPSCLCRAPLSQCCCRCRPPSRPPPMAWPAAARGRWARHRGGGELCAARSASA